MLNRKKVEDAIDIAVSTKTAKQHSTVKYGCFSILTVEHLSFRRLGCIPFTLPQYCRLTPSATCIRVGLTPPNVLCAAGRVVHFNGVPMLVKKTSQNVNRFSYCKFVYLMTAVLIPGRLQRTMLDLNTKCGELSKRQRGNA